MDLSQEFTEIIQNNTADKYIYENRNNPEISLEFIQFLYKTDLQEYIFYKRLLVATIDVKLQEGIFIVFNLIILSLEKNLNLQNLTDFVEYCNGLSTTQIQKYKTFTLLPQILKHLVRISELSYKKEWKYESYVILYTTSQFITTSGTFPSKKYFFKYLNITSKIFLESNNFVSFFNCIKYMKSFDEFCASSFGTKKEFEKLHKYSNYKNESSHYLQLMCKLKFDNVDIINKNLKFTNLKIKEEKSIIQKYVNFNFWDFYEKNIGNKINFNENLKFISWMIRNDLKYERLGDECLIKEYKYTTISDKIYEITNLYEIKEQVTKHPKEIKKTSSNKTIPDIKPVKQKKKTIIFKDNFFEKKAIFNIKCDILKNKFNKRELFYFERNEQRRQMHEKFINEINQKRNFFEPYFEQVESLIMEDESHNSIQNINLSEEYVPTRNVTVQSKSSWRDEQSEVFMPSINLDNKKLISDNKSKRNIYTYSEQGSMIQSASSDNMSAAYKINMSDIKDFKMPSSDAYVPDIKSVKTDLTKKTGVFSKSNISNRSDKDIYTPPSLSTNTNKKQSFGFGFKNTSWYPGNNKN